MMPPEITQANPTPEGENLTTQTAPGPVPYDRFQEIVRAKNELAARLDKIEKAEAKRKQDEQIAAGEFQKAIEDLRPKAARLDELENVLTGLLSQELEAMPEANRENAKQVIELIPTPEGKLKALRQLAQVMTPARPTAAPMDAGKGGGPKYSGLSPLELDIAQQMGMTPEQYLKRKQGA